MVVHIGYELTVRELPAGSLRVGVRYAPATIQVGPAQVLYANSVTVPGARIRGTLRRPPVLGRRGLVCRPSSASADGRGGGRSSVLDVGLRYGQAAEALVGACPSKIARS